MRNISIEVRLKHCTYELMNLSVCRVPPYTQQQQSLVCLPYPFLLASRNNTISSSFSKVNLFFSFGRTLYFEYPLRNPFGHEERFVIDLQDSELRVITNTEEWTYLRR